MTNQETVSLYENEEFQAAAHDTLRPGGLDLTKKAMGIARFAEQSRILDLGSGCGKTVEYLRETMRMRAVGLDVSDKMAAKARSLNSTLEIVVGDICRLPCADGAVDGVFCECVLNLLEDKPLALMQMNRVLRRGGKLIVSDLYLREKTGDFSGLPRVSCINGITARDLQVGEVAAAGFRLVDWQDETPRYKEFVAGLIMRYGSMSVFWEGLTGSCREACAIQGSLRKVKIGYYLSVWEKDSAS